MARFRHDGTFVEVLRSRAADRGEKKVFTFLRDAGGEHAQLSYAELDRRARAIAVCLLRNHKPGDRALLLFPPGLDYIAAFFGCLYAGVIAVPAYPPNSARLQRSLPRLVAIAKDSAATAVLATSELVAMSDQLSKFVPELSFLDWIACDAIDLDGASDWNDPDFNSDEIAFLQYTSGSTGDPKGVALTHGNLLANQTLIQRAFRTDEATSGVSWLPPYHDMGLIGGILHPIYFGGHCALMSPFDFLREPLVWLRAIHEFGGTVSGAPNFAYDLCVRKISPAEREKLDLSTWEVAFNGAEPVRMDTIDRFCEAFQVSGFRRRAILPCYGLAEATLIVTGGSHERLGGAFRAADLEQGSAIKVDDGDPMARMLVSSGPAESVRIVDPVSLTELPDGAVGEIWVANSSVAAGYFQKPELTAGAFGARTESNDGPFLRTGDLGFNCDGDLFVTGRLKDLVIIRGRNLYPQDIELTAEGSHPAIRPGSSAAFAIEAGGEERLVLVLAVERSLGFTGDEVVAAIRRAVAREHDIQPHAVVLVAPNAIPKTSSGKIQRRACREAYQSGELNLVFAHQQEVQGLEPASEQTAEAQEPESSISIEREDDTLKLLASRLAHHLSNPVQAIEPDTSIADFALDSLRAVELAHDLEKAFGVRIPIELFLGDASLGELAQRITALRAQAEGTNPSPARSGEKQEFVLSDGQRALWFLSQLDPQSPFYNVSNAFRLDGPLDLAALRRAFEALLVRHALLRATFDASSGEPIARVCDPSKLQLPFTVEEISADPGVLTARLNEDAQRPFDLGRDLPIRLRLFVLGPDEHVLLVSFHHLVMDFWSQRLLLSDLSALYLAEKAGDPPALVPLETDFADYATWQRELLAGEEGERLAQYWGNQLQGPLPVLELPTFQPRPPIQSFEGAVQKLRLGTDLTAHLKRFARERGTTPFVVLLAAYQTLLHRYTGQDDLVVGTVTAGRTHATFAEVVGYMVNTVALRGRPQSDLSFDAFVAETKKTVLAAFEHQDIGFSRIVERIHPQRDPARSPVFQTMFVLQNAHGPEGDALTRLAMNEDDVRLPWADLVLEGIPLEQGIAQFDLTLTMGEAGGDFIATFDYCTALFEPAFIEAMAEHYRNLLWGVIRTPDRALGELPVLSDADIQKLANDWNDTARPASEHASVQAWIEAVASRCPQEVALVSGGESLGYTELETRANRVAHRLIREGVRHETLVGLRFERGIDLVVAMIAVLKAGGAFLPIDPLYPDERIEQMLDDAAVGILLTHASFAPAHTTRQPRKVLAFESLVSDSSDEPSTPPAVDMDPHHLACVIHTSGSTGLPKGTMVEHRALLNLIASFHESYAPTTADRILPLTSSASISFVGEVFPILCAGGAVVIPSREEMLDEAQLQALIESTRVTILSTLPSRIMSLENAATSLAHLRLLLSGGEALNAADLSHLSPNIELVNGYGLTETGACSTYHRIERAELAEGRTVPIGKPIRNTQVYVLDSALRQVPVGCVGELFIAGDGLARGYLNRPDLTAERFIPNPFVAGGRMYRTGDLARFTAQGCLEFVGRLDHQVKIRGHRIELAEIEVALRRHPAVRDAVVVVRGDSHLERQLVAYWTPKTNATVPPAEAFLAYLRELLPEHMAPAFVVMLPELPLLPNGKVAREALPEPQGARLLHESSYVAPRNVLERQIAEVWKNALHLDQVGMEDSFFDLGGHSLLLAQVHQQLKTQLGRDLSLVDLFRFPTVGSLAAHLDRLSSRPEKQDVASPRMTPSREGIAIIGMAGRFPGAESLFEFWDNLRSGVEAITQYTADELIAAGIDPDLVNDPNYIKAKGAMGNVDTFDAAFFGVSPREAELMDPQHRVFLECAWEAMERAGYDSLRYPGRIGVFGGASMNTYLVTNLISHMKLVASTDTLQASLGNDKDPLTSRVAYKMGLRGPSITIQSASSTSLVAVHTACESLNAGNCEMALAGGVSIHLPEKSGYMYQDGGTTSRDGHCRAFDAEATGFVSGNGAGIVVLKRLSDAIRDGDHIHAVIQGTACNNDGAQKVSFTAPSVEGQVDVYRQALAAAELSPGDVGYIECHGTGTAMGDPIEIAALDEVYGGGAREAGSVALGSLKTNIGHLDVAAGVCGLIKAALTVEHGEFVPTLHFKTPNPRIDFEKTPFVVNTKRRAWDSKRRLAGVTALGMGGTNAHVIVGEAPRPEAPGDSRKQQLLVLSAKTPTALDALSEQLATHLEKSPELPLADVSHVLLGGRRAFGHRRALICSSREEAIASLRTGQSRDLMSATFAGGTPSVAFMFPGQGSQYVGMGRGLYDSEPVFRAEVDRACELLRDELGFDLREKLYPAHAHDDAEGQAASLALEQTAVTQPALFVIEHALAKLLMSWGIQPQAMVGHSLGEYVAACLAGVFDLPDALALVAARGRLMQAMAPGSMLAVPASQERIAPMLPEVVTVATVNDPNSCVVAGPTEAVLALQQELEGLGIAGRVLRTSHAFHSAMLDPALPSYLACVRKVALHRPRIPFLSNVTGTWITDAQATDPAYWVSQMRQPVLFAQAVGVLLEEPSRVCVEVGPGQGLASSVRQHPASRGHEVVAAMRHPKSGDDDQRVVLRALGQLWNAGVQVDPAGFFAGERRRRVILPTYPFERKRFWVEPKKTHDRPSTVIEGRAPEGDWYYAPKWSEAVPLRRPSRDLPSEATSTWVIAADPRLPEGLLEGLTERSGPVTLIRPGQRYLRVAPAEAEVAIADPKSWEQAFSELAAPSRIVVLAQGPDSEAPVASTLDKTVFVPLALAQALGKQDTSHEVDLVLVSQGVFDVFGTETTDPVRMSILGPVRVIPLEYPTIRCRLIDLPGGSESMRVLLREIVEPSRETEVALRGGRRWVRSHGRVPLPGSQDAGTAALRDGGTYVITGGLGGIGLELAGAIASRVRANLVLMGRTGLPPRRDWETIALGDDDQAMRVRRLLDLEARHGAQVEVIALNVADAVALRAALAGTRERFGSLHGVIHAAGMPGGGLILNRQREAASTVFEGKLLGALALDAALEGEQLDFVVLCSSLTVDVPMPGQTDYVSANAVLDALAEKRSRQGLPYVAIQWDAWREVGMALRSESELGSTSLRSPLLSDGLSSEEGVTCFLTALGSGLASVLVSTHALSARQAEPRTIASLEAVIPRNAATDTAISPESSMRALARTQGEGLEEQVAAVWREMLGVPYLSYDDGFFDLGGTSLIAISLMQRLREETGVELSVARLFTSPTVRGIANFVRESLGVSNEEATVAQESMLRGQRRRDRRTHR